MWPAGYPRTLAVTKQRRIRMRAMRAWIIVLVITASQSASAASLKELSETKSLSNEIMDMSLLEME